MAKRSRKKQTQERFIRAQPRELNKIRLRVNKPVEEITKIQTIPKIFWNIIVKKEKQAKKDRKKIPLVKLKGLATPCEAKKADARHNYFSMRKSGKGALRTNSKTDRFNSRC